MKKEKRLTDLKRESIVAAALQEFKDNGFTGTSMDKIAARAEVSKRTLYNHFPSKDALFENITNSIWEQSIKATELPFDPNKTLREQLIHIAQQEVTLLAQEEYQSLCRVFITECINNQELAQQAMARFSETETGIGQWLQAAIDSGQFKPADANFAKEQFMALIKAFAFWPQTLGRLPMPSKKDQKQIIESAVDMFLGHYAA